MWRKAVSAFINAVNTGALVFFSAGAALTTIVTRCTHSTRFALSLTAACVHSVISFTAKGLQSADQAEEESEVEPSRALKISHGFILFGNAVTAWFAITVLADFWWLNLIALPFMYGVVDTYRRYNLSKAQRNVEKLKVLIKYPQRANKKALIFVLLLTPIACISRACMIYWFFNSAFSKLLQLVFLDLLKLHTLKTAVGYISEIISVLYSVNYTSNYLLTKSFALYEGASHPAKHWPQIRACNKKRIACGVGITLLLLIEIPSDELGYAMGLLYAAMKMGIIKEVSSTAKIISLLVATPATIHDMTFYIRESLENAMLSHGLGMFQAESDSEADSLIESVVTVDQDISPT